MSPKQIANCVLKLSDYFIENPSGRTPWQHDWAQIAYLNYYLPLNRMRANAVVAEAQQQNFFADLEDFYDFGAGLGSASLALMQAQHSWKNQTLIEISSKAHDIARMNFPELSMTNWQSEIHHHDIKNPQKSLAVFSYSLTELKHIPNWALDCEAVMIIEPATEEDGRKLMQLRNELIEKGYTIYAPCTHHENCPLLNESKHDWCHHRVHTELSPDFLAIESFRPMKNQTITLSYLLARKKPRPQLNGQVRVVGDQLHEKGKTRQMICRGPEREFLAWLERTKIEIDLRRGQVIEISPEAEKKSNEVRISTLQQIKIIQ